jgi:hypothetical protein
LLFQPLQIAVQIVILRFELDVLERRSLQSLAGQLEASLKVIGDALRLRQLVRQFARTHQGSVLGGL